MFFHFNQFYFGDKRASSDLRFFCFFSNEQIGYANNMSNFSSSHSNSGKGNISLHETMKRLSWRNNFGHLYRIIKFNSTKLQELTWKYACFIFVNDTIVVEKIYLYVVGLWVYTKIGRWQRLDLGPSLLSLSSVTRSSSHVVRNRLMYKLPGMWCLIFSKLTSYELLLSDTFS